jgi:hypothetical protein
MPRVATFLLCSIVAAFAARPVLAAGPVSEDVPVPGGTAAIAQSLGIAPVPDRARFVAEVARLTHPAADDRGSTRARTALVLQRSESERTASASPESVPIPLTTAIWSAAVFHRPIAPDHILWAILADRRAAHLCYGLASLNDETLEFLAGHPALLSRLYEHTAAVFASAGNSLRVHQNHLVLPGGERAADLWAAVVGEPPDEIEPFVRALFELDEGRLAYLYDVIAELDAPRAAFALGLWMKDPSERVRRFKALAAVNRTAIPQWQLPRLPFSRALHDIASILERVGVEPDGRPSAPALRADWAWIFERGESPASVAGRGATTNTQESLIDAAWLAQNIAPLETMERGERLDQLAFGQRAFGRADGSDRGAAVSVIRLYPRYRMLLLSLERSGVSRPPVYLAATKRAEQLAAVDSRRLFFVLGQFQSSLALLTRMASVHTLNATPLESLVTSLSNVAAPRNGTYAKALAAWIQQQLRPVLAARLPSAAGAPPAGVDLEELLVQALAGTAPGAHSVERVEWEGDVYRLDIAASEERRLRRVREKQGGLSLDEAVARGTDEALADALMAWTYALSITDPDSPVLLTGGVTRRHNFGLSLAPGEHGVHGRVAWALPRQDIAVGVPWHVTGSLLGLDVALSGLALRRTNGETIDAPTLSSNERDAFATGLALLNPFDLRDVDRDAIASAVERGQARVAALTRETAVEEVAAEIQMDGWRQRALKWTVVNEPDRVGSFFSMTELLLLGRAPLAGLSAWGMSALTSEGCFCTRLEPPAQWRSFIGRPQLGLMASTVADLNLHIAVTLRRLRLPAAVAKSVLSAAVQDFIDEARPTDFNDWLTLVRTAQAVPRERIEDYVAVATANGPLLPYEQ